MRYLIGIDLGTTNSCVTYVDTDRKKNPALSLTAFPIPQIGEGGVIAPRATLPSFCYLLDREEKQKGLGNLPWLAAPRDYIVGAGALDKGGAFPRKLVHAAKSWLCHPAVDRRAPLLPFDPEGGSEGTISPVEATARYLSHIREVWNERFGKEPDGAFDEQELVLTVPASFDEAARQLTIEAAKLAGYRQLTLLEEPQAAFYSWISQNAGKEILQPGDHVLVCDVGGGTTDFSLIDVQGESEKGLAFQRMAVGRHLLLGGDNMDYAVAHFLEQKLGLNEELPASSWQRLLYQARLAKEALLGDKSPTYTAVLTSGGSRLVAETRSVTVSKEEVCNLLIQGFFPERSFDEACSLIKTEGLRKMGLPFEEEPSILNHLAVFLRQAGVVPTALLFNGGAMKPKAFQEAVYNALKRWFPEIACKRLESESLDLAVSRGAAYYGKVRAGLGIRIRSGLPRSLYLAVGGEEKVLTLLARGAEEGTTFSPEKPFLVKTNEPVAFQLYTSETRLNERSGDWVEREEQTMRQLPPLHTALRYGKKKEGEEKIPVRLEVAYTEMGILDLNLVSVGTPHRWKLEFQLRGSTGRENALSLTGAGRRDETFSSDCGFIEEAKSLIKNLFQGGGDPKKIVEQLEQALGSERMAWAPSLCRDLFEIVFSFAGVRGRSLDHEVRFWHLIGFLMRPGFGYPLDDYRIKELWKLVLSLPPKAKDQLLLAQCIAFRRVAGGFNRGQQQQLAQRLWPELFKKEGDLLAAKSEAERYLLAEKLRAVASFELLDVQLKMRLGDLLLEEKVLSKDLIWSLGRLGARQMVYGSLTDVVPASRCRLWAEKLLSHPVTSEAERVLALSWLARRSDCRELNLPKETSERVASWLKMQQGELSLEAKGLSTAQQAQLLGDTLPHGLSFA